MFKRLSSPVRLPHVQSAPCVLKTPQERRTTTSYNEHHPPKTPSSQPASRWPRYLLKGAAGLLLLGLITNKKRLATVTKLLTPLYRAIAPVIKALGKAGAAAGAFTLKAGNLAVQVALFLIMFGTANVLFDQFLVLVDPSGERSLSDPRL